MTVSYKPSFIRQFRKLEPALQQEAVEKIELFRNPANHRGLGVHKLQGPLVGRWSFSVNFKYRIVFRYETKSEVALLAIGDHEIYR